MWCEKGGLIMKKNSMKGYIILGIIFVLLSVIVFLIPVLKTVPFWITYVFTVIAFLMQIFIWKKVFLQEKTLKDKFLELPIVHIGVVYLILQSIILVVFTAIPTLPLRVAIVINVFVFVIFLVCTISSDVAHDEIMKVEEKVNQKVTYMKELQSEIEIIIDSEMNPKIKEALVKLADTIRYSDPMSCDDLVNVEERISDKVKELKVSEDKGKVIQEITLLLQERNVK